MATPSPTDPTAIPSTPHTRSLEYRPEIDGLRGVAVLAVLLYHAEFGGGSLGRGGYVGVDVFFVISGYLITAILLRELGSGRFDPWDFYARRARRLLPVLGVVLAASMPFAWAWMSPKAAREFAGSVLASLVFGSNVWFFLEDSYTAELSALKPLLHTWSLAVEEQFYILYPWCLALLWKLSRQRLAAWLGMGFIGSLLLAQWASGAHPDAAFYLLPTRGWELLAGALLACGGTRPAHSKHLEFRRGLPGASLPALGLFLIMLSCVLFDATTRHPSVWTLVPVVGSMLVIGFGGGNDPASRLLRSRPLVAVGLISYGLYLWHLPVLVFARLRYGVASDTQKLGLLALSFGLAALSYRCVERPFRRREQVPRASLVAALTLLFLGVGVAAFDLQRRNSSFSWGDEPFDLAHEKRKRMVYRETICPKLSTDPCPHLDANSKDILVVGDSMALDAINILRHLFPEYHYALDSAPGCAPHPDISRVVADDYPFLGQCEAVNARRFSPASLEHVDGVVIFNIFGLLEPEDLVPYLDFLHGQGVERVMVFSNYLRLQSDMENYILQSTSKDEVIRQLRDEDQVIRPFKFDQQLQALVEPYGYEAVILSEYACDKRDCVLFLGPHPFTWDRFHFSAEFSEYLARVMEKRLRRSWLSEL